ncbi:Tat pathway signal protein [Neisseria sp. 23W00296]|uniref:Tat pathway signal sequence domain protein n=1 Tax=unclassified Neisseria TaxID=2623750 RepID=UPI0002A37E89|nr:MULTISPECIES: Tat pathway signal sequence domain protein [unclassified Neisseria]ASP16580.1 Tat pathway signal protein [Neisseria sp. KEM232]EKY03315.1 Tat pathway signal sequence domain protein [Neisseria sp. oral taxon 020 str. F0370]
MPTRREFLLSAAGATVLFTVGGCAALGGASDNAVESATAVTRVFGDGMRLVAVAVKYRDDVSAAALEPSQYSVAGRTVERVYVAQSADGMPSERGRFVIVQLNPYDDGALLTVKKGRPAGKSANADPAKNGPGKAGDKGDSAPTLKAASAEVNIGGQTFQTAAVINEVFDDFVQREYADKQTGKTVRYNLFAPKNIEDGKRYPLVLFMHDAGVTGTIVKAPLYQGNGAIAWASPGFQAQHPCFVIAPEFDEIIVDDTSTASNYLDATINLIKHLQTELPIDGNRLYTTGQSGGGMMSIAMNIKYPDFFAASYLVACQWNPALLTPQMKNVKWWITVSQDDAKAYPGEIAITEKLAAFGAKVARADDWNAQWPADKFQTAFDKIAAQNANVNFVAFAKGTVFKTAAEANAGGASGHTSTWKYAYNIAPVLDWIFRQSKA